MSLPRVAAVSLVVGAALATAVFQYFSEDEFIVRLAEEDIRNKLKGSLPLACRIGAADQFTIHNPRVHLEEGGDRVCMVLDIDLGTGAAAAAFTGTVEVFCGVEYRSREGAFFLADTVLERLDVARLSGREAGLVGRKLTQALDRHWRAHPIYTLKLASADRFATHMTLRDTEITEQHLLMTLAV